MAFFRRFSNIDFRCDAANSSPVASRPCVQRSVGSECVKKMCGMMRLGSRSPCISVMKATDLSNRHHVTPFRRLDLAGRRCVSIKGKVRAGLVIIGEVAFEDVHEVRLIEHDHVIQTFTPDGANQPFNIRRLPRRSKGDWNLLDAHAFDALAKIAAVDRVSVTNHVFGRFVPRKRLNHLLGRPSRRGMLGHVEVNHATASMTQNDEDEQQLETYRRNDEEVYGHHLRHVILDEGLPILGWWYRPISAYETGYGSFRDVDAEHQQFAMNLRSTPSVVALYHSDYESPDFRSDRRPSSLDTAGLTPPIKLEVLFVPGHDCFRLYLLRLRFAMLTRCVIGAPRTGGLAPSVLDDYCSTWVR